MGHLSGALFLSFEVLDMRGRELIFCAIFFLVGNCLGGWLPSVPWAYLLVAAALSFCAVRHRDAAVLLPCFLLLGISGLQVAACFPDTGVSAISAMASDAKDSFSLYLDRFAPPGDERAILKALTIGDRSGISRDLRRIYRDAGAMHLLALSGLHVGIIYGVASLALSFLGGGRAARVIRTAVILTFLWTYAVVSGLSPSISRAVVMITVYEISGFISAGKNGLTSLAASALLTTLFSPESPHNVGFQLSYSAVLAIHTIHPRLKGLLDTRSVLLRKVWDTLSIAISCQATCGVIGWLYFGTFPQYFLLTNLMAVPVATVAMHLIAASLLTSAIPGLGELCAAGLRSALWLLNKVLEIISGLDGIFF